MLHGHAGLPEGTKSPALASASERAMFTSKADLSCCRAQGGGGNAGKTGTPMGYNLGKLSYFTNLNSSAIWGWFPLLTMIPVRENSEVVVIYPESFPINQLGPLEIHQLWSS